MPPPASRWLTDDELKWFGELVHDIKAKPHRLSEWEKSFVADVIGRWTPGAVTIRLSDKQIEIFRRIEAKIHAAG